MGKCIWICYPKWLELQGFPNLGVCPSRSLHCQKWTKYHFSLDCDPIGSFRCRSDSLAPRPNSSSLSPRKEAYFLRYLFISLSEDEKYGEGWSNRNNQLQVYVLELCPTIVSPCSIRMQHATWRSPGFWNHQWPWKAWIWQLAWAYLGWAKLYFTFEWIGSQIPWRWRLLEHSRKRITQRKKNRLWRLRRNHFASTPRVWVYLLIIEFVSS